MADADLSLRDYFDGSLDLFCEISLEGRFQFVNSAWTTLLGYASCELIGQNFEDFLHPLDRMRSRKVFDDRDSQGKRSFRNRYRHKNGSYLTFLWSGHVDHRRGVVFGHARDVSDDMIESSLLSRVAAIQDVYMRMGTKNRNLFEQILTELLPALECTDGFIADIHTDEITAERSLSVYARTVGISIEMVTNSVAEVIRTGRADSHGATEQNSFCVIPLHDLGQLVGIIGVAHRHGGFTPEFLRLAKPVIEVIGSIMVLYNSSLRENALRERFVVIVENLPMMLTEYGPDGNVTWANKYFRDKLGFSEAEIASGPELTGVLKSDAERARTFMLSGRTDWEEFTLHNRNGESFQSVWTNIRLKDGRAIGIGQDVTERRIAEAKMIQSSKMASLGEMSAGVSHEINNPLTIIQGSAFRALQNLGNLNQMTATQSRDEVEGDLNRIIQNCDRIARIVRGLLAFCRSAEHEPFLPTPLSSVVDDVLNLAYERFINHKIKIEISLQDSPTLDCRPVQLGQVLMNLLNNAYDAVSVCEEDKRIVWVHVTTTATTVQISVEDSGPGISIAVRDRILEPFFTTKDVGKGTGLGLSISKGIIDSHGGKLWLDTASKRTRFVVQLPLRQTI